MKGARSRALGPSGRPPGTGLSIPQWINVCLAANQAFGPDAARALEATDSP